LCLWISNSVHIFSVQKINYSKIKTIHRHLPGLTNLSSDSSDFLVLSVGHTS
jgi:hypothetical protein